MSRNSQDRLGVQPEQTQPEKKINILDFVNPTEFVKLPSKGKIYDESHPLHNKESIEIKSMSTMEIDLLTNQNLIEEGVVIQRLLDALIVDPDIKTDSLLPGDQNAIVVAARISGFGPEYEVEVQCPNEKCHSKHSHVLDLREITHQDASIDAKDGIFEVRLPVSGLNAKCKLLNGGEYEQLNKKLDQNQNSANFLKQVIVSIENETDRGIISQFIDLMPALDNKIVRKEYTKANPNMDFTASVKCRKCKEVNRIQIPLSVNFFWSIT